jgi:hypothetical protein
MTQRAYAPPPPERPAGKSKPRSPLSTFWSAYYSVVRDLSDGRTSGDKQLFLVLHLLGITLGQPEEERRLISKPVTLTDLGNAVHCSKKHTGELLRDFRERGGLNRYNDMAAKMIRRELRGVSDQEGYTEALATLKRSKLDLRGWPEQFDARWIEQIVEDLAATGGNAQAYRYMLVPQNWAAMEKCEPELTDEDWEEIENSAAETKPVKPGTVPPQQYSGKSGCSAAPADPNPSDHVIPDYSQQETFRGEGWDEFFPASRLAPAIVGIHRQIERLHVAEGLSVGTRGADLYILRVTDGANKGADEPTVPPQAHGAKSRDALAAGVARLIEDLPRQISVANKEGSAEHLLLQQDMQKSEHLLLQQEVRTPTPLNTPAVERETLRQGLPCDKKLAERIAAGLANRKESAADFVAFVKRKNEKKRKTPVEGGVLISVLEEFLDAPRAQRSGEETPEAKWRRLRAKGWTIEEIRRAYKIEPPKDAAHG